jgi:hypothetical protein
LEERKGGFPHSEICGSKGARASPHLIAACHVLLRLSMPRHPSEALIRLIILTKLAPRGARHSIDKAEMVTSQPRPYCQTMSSIFSDPPWKRWRRRVNPPFTMSSLRTAPRLKPRLGPQDLVPSDRERTGVLVSLVPCRTAPCGARGAGRDRTDDLMLAKHALYRLSYSPIPQGRFGRLSWVVGPGRLELPTSRLSGVCSNQLSYRPKEAAFAIVFHDLNRSPWIGRSGTFGKGNGGGGDPQMLLGP